MKRLALALLLAASATACHPTVSRAPVTVTRPPVEDVCQEDEACWDCNVHGNGLCSADDTTPYEDGD